MKLIGLLSFFDEKPEHLAACLLGLKQLGAADVIALDGAYALYPDAQPASHPNQHAALVLAARQLGLALTLHVPAQSWQRNEVQKRTALFAHGWAVAKPGDWYVVMDTDMTPDVATIPDDLLAQLERTEHDVAEETCRDIPAVLADNRSWPKTFKIPSFFRAQPITVQTTHCTYVTDDGRVLWDGGPGRATRHDLTSLVINHTPHLRDEQRLEAKNTYYVERESQGIELGTCACGQQATGKIETRWRMTDIGPVADIITCCDRCAKRHAKQARRQLQAMGVDPDSVQVAHRYGQAPEPCVTPA